MIISDMVCAFIGLVALRAIMDRRPGTKEHQTACQVFDLYSVWGLRRARELGSVTEWDADPPGPWFPKAQGVMGSN